MEIDYAELISQNYDTLVRSMDPKIQFINKLRIINVIGKDDVTQITATPSADDKNGLLLTILLDSGSTARSVEGFLKALRSCGQEHVANIFDKKSDKNHMTDQHYQLLNGCMGKVEKVMDPDCGIVDELFSCGVFTDSDRDRINAVTADNAKASAILKTVLRKSDCCFGKFLDALDKSGQDHVTNLIEKRSERIPMADNHYHILHDNAGRLEQILDPDCGIIEELFRRGVLTDSNRQKLGTVAHDSLKSSTLVKTLLRKSDCCFQKIIEVLEQCCQDHVLYVLNELFKGQQNQQHISGSNVSPPIREEFIESMEKNRAEIVENMNPRDSGLLDFMIGCKVLRNYDRVDPRSLEEPRTCCDMNVEIMRFIPRISQAAFDRFIVSLIASGQSHIAALCVGEEVNGKITILYQDHVDEATRKRVECVLKLKLGDLIRNGIQVDNALKRSLTANNVIVSYVKDGCIAIGFRCLAADSFVKFRQMYETHELGRLLMDSYYTAISDSSVMSLDLTISDEEFTRCASTLEKNKLMTASHRETLLLAAKSPRVLETVVVTDDLLKNLSLCERRKQAIKRSVGQKRVAALLESVCCQPDWAFDELVEVLSKLNHKEAVQLMTYPSCKPEWKATEQHLEATHDDGLQTKVKQQPAVRRLAKRKRRARAKAEMLQYRNKVTPFRELDEYSDMQFYRDSRRLLTPLPPDPYTTPTHSTATQYEWPPFSPVGRRIRRDASKVQDSSTGECDIVRLSVELIELVLMRTLMRLIFHTGDSVLDIKYKSTTDFLSLSHVEYDNREPPYLYFSDTINGRIPVSYKLLAAVSVSWWRTMNGWPQSPTPHWLKHKLRHIFANSSMLQLDAVRNLLPKLIHRHTYGTMQFLHCLLKNDRSLSEMRCRAFVQELQQQGLEHVVNYIRHRGVYEPIKCGDIWPLHNEQVKLLRSDSRWLVENVDVNDRLLSRLLSLECIDKTAFNKLKSTADKYIVARELMEIVSWTSIAKFGVFIDCLKDDNQLRVAEMLQVKKEVNYDWFETQHFLSTIRMMLSRNPKKTSAKTHQKFTAIISTALQVMDLPTPICRKIISIGNTGGVVKFTKSTNVLEFNVLAVMSNDQHIDANPILGHPGFVTLCAKKSVNDPVEEPQRQLTEISDVPLPGKYVRCLHKALSQCAENIDIMKGRIVLKCRNDGDLQMEVVSSRDQKTQYFLNFIPCCEIGGKRYTGQPCMRGDKPELLWRRCFAVDEDQKRSNIVHGSRPSCYIHVITALTVIASASDELQPLSHRHFEHAAFYVFDKKPSKFLWEADRIGARIVDVLKKIEEFLDYKFMPDYFLPKANLFCALPPERIDILRSHVHELITSETKLINLMMHRLELIS